MQACLFQLLKLEIHCHSDNHLSLSNNPLLSILCHWAICFAALTFTINNCFFPTIVHGSWKNIHMMCWGSQLSRNVSMIKVQSHPRISGGMGVGFQTKKAFHGIGMNKVPLVYSLPGILFNASCNNLVIWLACVAGVERGGEWERGKKGGGLVERGGRMPAIRTPFWSFLRPVAATKFRLLNRLTVNWQDTYLYYQKICGMYNAKKRVLI